MLSVTGSHLPALSLHQSEASIQVTWPALTNQRPPVLVTILLRARAETLMGPSRETPEPTQPGTGTRRRIKRGNALKCLTLYCYVWGWIVIHKHCASAIVKIWMNMKIIFTKLSWDLFDGSTGCPRKIFALFCFCNLTKQNFFWETLYKKILAKFMD